MPAIIFGSIGTIADIDQLQPDSHDVDARTDASTDARPGVLSLIERAKNEGVRLALVTARPPSTVAATIDGLGAGVRDSFEFILDASALEEGVSLSGELDPTAFQSALDNLALEPSEALAVVSDRADLAAARAAGLWTVYFAHGPATSHGESETSIDAGLVIDRFDEQTAARVLDHLR